MIQEKKSSFNNTVSNKLRVASLFAGCGGLDHAFHKQKDTFTKWDKWIKTNDKLPFPNILKDLTDIELINCEYIGDKLIEVHLRHNEDFSDNITEFIPVWKGQDTTPPAGYTYRDYPDVHGRIGAFIK